MTASFLRVWDSLVTSYLAAYNRPTLGGVVPPLPPYTLINATGCACLLDLSHSGLQVRFGHVRLGVGPSSAFEVDFLRARRNSPIPKSLQKFLQSTAKLIQFRLIVVEATN